MRSRLPCSESSPIAADIPHRDDRWYLYVRVPNFLRYGQLVIELTDVPVVLGRSSSCDVVIDDDHASREHCRITVDGDRIVLTDLESKNGVLVNGGRVDQRVELHHGDTITIGAQQLVLQRSMRAPRVTPALGMVRPIPAWEDSGSFTLNPTRPGNLFTLLHGATMMSLRANDVTSAESSARSFFVSTRASQMRQQSLPPGTLDQAADLGIAMCEHTHDVRWLDQLLKLHTTSRIPMSDVYLERFVATVRAHGRPSPALDEYLQMALETGGASSIRALSDLSGHDE
jgi:predicted component of type VI protein secretion system